MKPANVLRPLCAALCGISLAALSLPSAAQDRPRDERPRDERAPEERPAEGPRPPRGDFKPDDRTRGEARPPEGRREEPRREEVRRDQAPRGEARPGERGEKRPGEGQRGGVNPQDLFRDLNDDQRAALRGFFETNQDVMREIGDRTTRLRREIAESALADKPDESLIRDKAMELAKLEADATIARARAFAKVRNQLPKETVERLRMMVANLGLGPRPGFQPQPQSGQEPRREGGDVRRPAGDNAGQPGRKPVEGPRPEAPRRPPADQ